MKRTEQDRLLNAMLGGREIATLRERSLQAGLASLQRRRRHQRALRTSAVVIAVFALAGVWWFGPRTRTPAPPVKLTQLAPSRPPALGSGVRFISDEELLALFPGRPVALIGKSGEPQQLIFLDARKETGQQDL